MEGCRGGKVLSRAEGGGRCGSSEALCTQLLSLPHEQARNNARDTAGRGREAAELWDGQSVRRGIGISAGGEGREGRGVGF